MTKEVMMGKLMDLLDEDIDKEQKEAVRQAIEIMKLIMKFYGGLRA